MFKELLAKKRKKMISIFGNGALSRMREGSIFLNYLGEIEQTVLLYLL